jgi:tetratricopeptide (TPR) repeat protein
MLGKWETGFSNCVLASLALCCVIIFLSPPPAIAASADVDTYSFVDTTSLVLQGSELSEEEARQLEEKLKADPENLPARIQLLGYYWSMTFDSDEAREAREKHVLWIIEHRPDSDVAGNPWVNLDPTLDGEVYYEAKKLWLQQVKEHNENTKVLGNAANFFLHNDEELSEIYLKEAQTLEPNNPYWPERLGFLYMLEGRYGKPPGAAKEMMQKALVQYEKAASLTYVARDRASLLSDLAETAFGAGDMEKAEAYALELLEKAGTKKGPWDYGSAVHTGNIILGQVSLREGDIDEAKACLLRAVSMPESNGFDHYYLDFTLAKELWREGEKDTVTEYLEQCRKFSEDPILERWIKMVKADIEPDFSHHWLPDEWESLDSANDG